MRQRMGRRQPGQSAVLLAFVILLIVVMVALSVDVGNAYGQQRRVQSMANAGAMTAMASVLTNNTNNGVWTDVQRTLSGNRAQLNANYTYTVDYILDDGTVELLGEWNGSTVYIPNGNSKPPGNLARVQVTMGERVATRFAGVIGQTSLNVNANGVACLGDYGFGVYPLGVPVSPQPPRYSANGKQITPGVEIFQANGQKLPPAQWGNWDTLKGMTIRLPVANGQNDYAPGVHTSWLNWGGDTQTVDGVRYEELSGMTGASDLKVAFTQPGTLHKGFLEAISPDAAMPNTKPIGTLQRGDWISGDPGAKVTVKDELEVLANTGAKLMLPMFDQTASKNGTSKMSFHMVNMGIFILRNVQLTGSPKYLDLMYLGEARAAPTECGSEETTGWSTTANKEFNIKGEVKLNNRVWRTGKNSGTTYDIVIVMDTSGSMRFEWNDNDPGYVTSASRINDAKRVIREFVQNFDISSATGDPDARIAFVTFGGDISGGNDPAKIQVGFSQACAASDIPADCGGQTNKWSSIQTKADSMTVSGGTPGPIAFEEVESLLQQKRTPPAGKTYKQIVVFATDGVFNICGNDKGERSCTYGYPSTNTADVNTASFNMVSGRPIWQAQQVANRIKNSGANIFVVALTPTCTTGTTCFDPSGLKDMSSGSKYYYQANDATTLTSIYEVIDDTIVYDTCVPHEITQPATNVTVVLTRPDNPTWQMHTVSDSAGNFQFTGLQAGEYVLKVPSALNVKSAEDGLTRAYSRVRNGRSLSEEGQVSAYINPQFPDGATVPTQLLLSLPLGADGTPYNGCTMPAP